jgi:hypothetical protein
MGTTTPVRGLYKPAYQEVGWDQQVNANFDNLDATANKSYVDSQDATKQNLLGYTAENAANKGAASGYASLDSGGKVPLSQLGNVPAAPVTSVATKTGAVTLVEGDIANLTTDLAAKEVSANKGVASGYASLDGTGNVPASQLGNAFVFAASAGLWLPYGMEEFSPSDGLTTCGVANGQQGAQFVCPVNVKLNNVTIYLSAGLSGAKMGIAIYSGDGLTKLSSADGISLSGGPNVVIRTALSTQLTLLAATTYWAMWTLTDSVTVKISNQLLTLVYSQIKNAGAVRIGNSTGATSGGVTLSTIGTPLTSAQLRVPLMFFD